MATALAALAAVALIGVAAHRLAGALLPRDDRATRAALALVLGAAMLCAGYGVLGQASTRATADVELVFFGDPAAAPRASTSQGAGEVRVYDERVTHARATPGHLVLVGLALALTALALPRPRAPTPRRAAPLLAALLWLPVALAALAALFGAARGYDALWYHLPLAEAFRREGHLEPPGRDLVFYFPANVELLARTFADLAGPRAMTLVQLPFALALGPLAAGVARRVGAGAASWIGGAIVVGCPIVVFQAGLAYCDVVALAGLAAALVLLLDVLAAGGPRALGGALAAGACLGLPLGAKYAALPLVACGLPAFAACALCAPGERRLRLRHAPRAVALGALVTAGLAAPSWFWFARNLRLSGNPLFPIALPALGLRGLFLPDAFNRAKELELVASRAEWPLYPFTAALSHESGFGAAFAALVPLATIALAPALLRALLVGRRPRALLPVAWGLGYVAAWWAGTPHEARHLLPIVLLLGAPAATLCRGASARARGLRTVAGAALALGAVVTLRLQLFSPVPELSARPAAFASLYDAPRTLADALDALPAGSRVANLAGRPYNLMLLGSGARLAAYDYSPGLPTLAELRSRGATHVFLRGPQALHDEAVARGAAPGRPWRALYRAEGGSAPRDAWRFWGTSPTDLLVLYALEK